MGLGSFGGGVGAVRFLLRRGAKVTVTDLADAETLADSMKQLADLPVEYHLGSHREEDFTAAHADLIVANPAVPCHSAYFATAEAQAVPVGKLRVPIPRGRAAVSIGATPDHAQGAGLQHGST